jgi:hypothetical protein
MREQQRQPVALVRPDNQQGRRQHNYSFATIRLISAVYSF